MPIRHLARYVGAAIAALLLSHNHAIAAPQSGVDVARNARAVAVNTAGGKTGVNLAQRGPSDTARPQGAPGGAVRSGNPGGRSFRGSNPSNRSFSRRGPSRRTFSDSWRHRRTYRSFRPRRHLRRHYTPIYPYVFGFYDFYDPYPYYYDDVFPAGRCAYWHRRCVQNWGYRNNNYYGCMRYYDCL
jgi:hypothetical protein